MPTTLANMPTVSGITPRRAQLFATAGLSWIEGDFLKVDPTTGLAVQAIAVNTTIAAAAVDSTAANQYAVRMDYPSTNLNGGQALTAGFEFSAPVVMADIEYDLLLCLLDAAGTWVVTLRGDIAQLRRTTTGQAYVVDLTSPTNGAVRILDITPASAGDTFKVVRCRFNPANIQPV
jgi:hypothetical protein